MIKSVKDLSLMDDEGDEGELVCFFQLTGESGKSMSEHFEDPEDFVMIEAHLNKKSGEVEIVAGVLNRNDFKAINSLLSEEDKSIIAAFVYGRNSAPK